jgi:hypothetical protein
MLMSKNIATFALFSTEEQLSRAISLLKDSGFRNTDISCLIPHGDGFKELVTEKHSKAPEGATAGTSVGGVVGGTVGWLAGVGAITIPGIGPFLAAGPIVAALAGIGVGATVGAVGGALVGAGIPEYEAKRYEGLIRKGKLLLSVHCDDSDWAAKAKHILKDAGAEGISSTKESVSYSSADEQSDVYSLPSDVKRDVGVTSTMTPPADVLSDIRKT